MTALIKIHFLQAMQRTKSSTKHTIFDEFQSKRPINWYLESELSINNKHTKNANEEN